MEVENLFVNANQASFADYLSSVILGQFDRIMILEYCGKEYTAIYTIAYHNIVVKLRFDPNFLQVLLEIIL